MTRTVGIRLDRRLELEWLDAVAARVAAGEGGEAIRAGLFDLLAGSVRGGARCGSACHKTVGVLFGTWADVPADLRSFRDHAIGVLAAAAPGERVALHWAMLVASYAFFADIARNTGRLLALQGNVALAQITRRMREAWGDRSTVHRATQRVVRSMVQWSVLSDTREHGVYVRSAEPFALCQEPAMCAMEGLLLHEGRALTVAQAVRHPALFPFALELRIANLRQSPRFEVYRQGVDVDMVSLASGRCGQS